MELLELIHTRHSISKVKPDPVPTDMIEKLLLAAVQAPNHHRVRPWRFIVLQGEARERLGEVMALSLKSRIRTLPRQFWKARKSSRCAPLCSSPLG